MNVLLFVLSYPRCSFFKNYYQQRSSLYQSSAKELFFPNFPLINQQALFKSSTLALTIKRITTEERGQKNVPLIESGGSLNAIIIMISRGSRSITLGHESSTGLRDRVLEAGIANEWIYQQDLMRVLSKNVEV